MDTGTIVPTQSLQRIFTPILSQITELLIVTSEHYETESTSDSINLLRPLVSMSEDIVESLKDLTTVCQQTITLEYPDDTVVKQEVECGSQNLLVTGESLVLCCHILCSATKPNFQLKTPVPHQNDVAGCLSDLNQCMLLLLLSIDDAEVRKIATYGLATSDGLASLATADSLQRLNDEFRSFAIPAANLHISASSRCSDMLDEKFQYKLRCALATLRQSLPMLATALQMAIKYPENAEVLKGRDFCVEQVRKSIADITKIVTMRQPKKSFLPGTKTGLFCEKLNEIKGMLSADKRKKLKMLPLHASTESFVQHAMELSLTLLKCSPPLEHKSSAVVGSCRKMMRSLRELEKSDEALEHHTSLEKKLRESFNEKCTSLNAVAQGTMASVVYAVITLVTHMFKTMDEPMADLVDACVSPATVTKDSMEKMKEQKIKEKRKVSNLSKIFSKHVADLTTAARFSASCCHHAGVYQKYSKVLSSFDQASRAIVMAASEYFENEESSMQEDGEGNDLVKNDRIMDLQDRWIITLGDLIQLVVASLDLKELLDVIVVETTDLIEKCVEGIVNMDESQIATSLQKAMGKSRFLSRVANSVVSCSTDPVYRNGVLAHVKGLKHNIANCIARGNQLIEDVGRVEQQELFTNDASNLLDSVKAVSEAILSDGNHPDLTSTNRLNVRDDDSSETNAVLREMRALNEKLIRLGFDPITDDEVGMSYPVPSSSEPGWPRYYYKDDQTAQHHEKTAAWAPSPNTSQVLDMPDYSPAVLESLPDKIHPIMEHVMQCLNDAHSKKSPKHIALEKAKDLISKASEICSDIANDTLLESQIANHGNKDRTSVRKAATRISTLKDLIFKEVDDLLASGSDQLEIEPLCVLGLQWSKALHTISIGCSRILPLHIVPVRRYLALSLDADVEYAHNLARCIVSYPGSPSKFVKKLASFKEDLQEKDKLSIGDFKVHEQNVKELVQLVDAISGLLSIEEEEEDAEDDDASKQEEIVALCDIINFDWTIACKTKAEILSIVHKLTPDSNEPIEKAMLQLHCLAWASKVHSLQCSVLRAAKFILEIFEIGIEDFGLYDMITEASASKAFDMKHYKEHIAEHIMEHSKIVNSANMGRDTLIATWDENLQVTNNVMDEILDHLSSARSSVPLVFHHGHSMFHFIYLHHLFFMILSYLKLTMKQKENQIDTERSEPDKRLSLSARLKSLKEEREERDESLKELLVGVPKLEE